MPKPLIDEGGQRSSSRPAQARTTGRLLLDREIDANNRPKPNKHHGRVSSKPISVKPSADKPVIVEPPVQPPPQVVQQPVIPVPQHYVRGRRVGTRVYISQYKGVTVYNNEAIDPRRINMEKNIHIYHNYIPDEFTDGYKVLCLFMEPEAFRVRNDIVISRQHQFDVILAHDPTLMAKCRNVEFFPFGSSWIKPEVFKSIDISAKQFKVSFICGSKCMTEGHRLRHEIWKLYGKLGMPHKFWASGSKPPKTMVYRDVPHLPSDPYAKHLLFSDSQFHIAIENTRVNNYFSEKLIDCLVTKTIPIYWGAPNIGDFFNTRGVFVVQDMQGIIDICNTTNEQEYYEMLPYVEENYRRAIPYTRDISERMRDVLMARVKED